MSIQDKVSVVIPVYNSEKFLKESIESVLNQTYENLEIIAVDDGSTDHSLDILKRYSDTIRIISQPNSGLGFAITKGINEIKGKWFKWFSPDDIMYPETIETLVSTAQILPENTIVYSNWEIIDEKGKKMRDFFEANYNDLSVFDFGVRLLDGQQINVNTSLIPVLLFERECKIRDLEDPVAIDYDFFLRAALLHNASFYLVRKSLLKYRIHSEQLSHHNIVKSLSYLDLLQQSILSELNQSKQEQYTVALAKYKREKSLSKKTLEGAFNIASKTFPSWVTDKLAVFYLNNIRSKR